MYFDYTIVLAFALAGGLYALVKGRKAVIDRPPHAGVEQVGAAGGRFTLALLALVSASAMLVLFPWALVLRDCLRDTDAAQSRGIGAGGLLAGALFLAILSIGVACASRKGDLDPDRGRSRDDPAANSGP